MWTLLLIAALPTDPKAALDDVDQTAFALETIRYGAVRTTSTHEAEVTELWRYVSESGGRFRIDYFGDTQRQIACDGQTLVEYVPARRQVRRYDLTQMPVADQTQLLKGILGKVTLPGIRSGAEAVDGQVAFAWGEDVTVAGRPAKAIVGSADAGSLVFLVDAEHGYLLSSEIREQGDFVVRTEAREHLEAAPGVWIPRQMTSTTPGPGGNVRVEVQLNRLAVGEDADDTLFSIEVDPSIPVTKIP